MKIGIYGGSFNPPHLGHLMLAEKLKEKSELHTLFIIPSNISPQKTDNGLIAPEHRLNMCKLMFSDSGYSVSDCEIKRGGKSYTLDTVKYIKALYPDDELFLFMGSDMFLSFHTWFCFEEILSLCKICAVSREDAECTRKMREYNNNVLGGKALIIDVDPIRISSSDIRRSIKNGSDCKMYLSEHVFEYIKENKLYV